jgi:hypothetical protein
MENQVDTLEILASNVDGYISSAYNSFSEGNTNRLERYQTTNNNLFSVEGPGYLSEDYDCIVQNNSLRLPASSSITYQIESIALASGIPAPTSTSVSDPYAISMLVDNDPNTYWAVITDTKDLSTQIASTDIVVNLLGVQQLSRVLINPFSEQPFNITGISYRKKIDTEVPIPIIVPYPIILTGETLIEFPTIYAQQIILHIEQANHKQLRYVVSNTDNTINQIFDLSTGDTVSPPRGLTGSNAKDSVYYAMTSNMKNLLGITTSLAEDNSIVDVYEFMYGLKTLEFSQQTYKNYGIFVSQSYNIPKLGAIGLEVNQAVVGGANLTSIEYDMFIESHKGTDVFYLSQAILPPDTDTIQGEVLDGSANENSNWECLTRFQCDDLGSIILYRNGIRVDENGYSVSKDTTTGRANIIVNASTIGWASIRSSVFTVGYTPLDSAYIVEIPSQDYAIINLRIFMRSIDPNRQLTPSITSFSLKYKKYTGQ